MGDERSITVGVLALQGAFEEHEQCLKAIGCSTKQVRTVRDLQNIDGIILPGGESTAMGLIGTANVSSEISMWDALKEFRKPIWGTCAGMILLAEKCIGTSAVIQDGQALIGGMNLTVCRNYFGSQVSSFEMATPPPPGNDSTSSFPGVFIRAPAILSVDAEIEVLGRVTAVPCRQAAVTLAELDRKIAAGENVVKLHVMDPIERENTVGLKYKVIVGSSPAAMTSDSSGETITLPGAATGSTARQVICAARRENILCTAFHPELTSDYRWHSYFVNMVKQTKS